MGVNKLEILFIWKKEIIFLITESIFILKYLNMLS